jgi:D-cysteine desulfhydrase
MPFSYPPRLELARTPTPIEPLSRLSSRLGVEIWIKRDDLTGTELSGNKVRKLEFLLAEARDRDCDAVITTGGVQSNHARATAIAAVRLGLAPYLLLRGDPGSEVQANLLLDRLVGAQVRFIDREQYATKRNELMQAWAEELGRAGRRAYVIPEGGSDEVGAWGYVRALEEVLEQARPKGLRFDTLVHATGSGGTSAGLVLGKKLLGFEGRVLGFAVCDDAATFARVVSGIVERAASRFALGVSVGREDLHFDDGYVGLGYARTRPEEVRNLVDVARSEGLILDPVYTNKAFYGMVSTLRREPRAFGDRVLFLHTGGIYGIFAQAPEIAAGL